MSGFNLPAAPAGVQVHERSAPTAANMQPGFVPPAAAPAVQGGTFTQADMDAAVAAARGTPAPAAAPAAVEALVPGAAINRPADLSTANDPVLSSMTDVFINIGTGIDMDRALGKALTHGDASLIDLAYIAEKGGAQANALTALAKGIVERVQAQAEAGAQAVYSAAGDKAQWTAAASVFDQSAPAHQKLVIKQMLDSGNPAAIAAAAQSVVEFAKASGLVINKPGMVNAGAATANAGQALSKADFQAGLQKLNTNSRTFAAERETLFQRRSLGKSLGL